MPIYILKHNHQYGPYEEHIVRRWLQTGECSPNDIAWRNGMRGWQPLGMILPLEIEPSLPPTLKNEVNYGSVFSSQPATRPLLIRDAPNLQTPLLDPPPARPILQRGQRSQLSNVIREVILAGLGFTTGILSAVILFILEVYAFSFHSFSMFFVIPVGAMLSGFGASSGYLVGAKLLNYRPRRSLLFCVFVIPLLTFFLIHGLEYLVWEINGRWAPEVVSFGEFLDTRIRDYSLSFFSKGGTSGRTGSLGAWGYAKEIVYILGFIFGGAWLHSFLDGIPHCLNCRRRLVKKTNTISVRYESERAEIESVLVAVSDLLNKGDEDGAWAKHSEQTDKSHLMKNPESTVKLPFRFTLMRWICSYCLTECFSGKVEKLSLSNKGDRNWASIKNFRQYAGAAKI